MARPFYPTERDPLPVGYKGDCAPERVWAVSEKMKSLGLAKIRTPDLSALSINGK